MYTCMRMAHSADLSISLSLYLYFSLSLYLSISLSLYLSTSLPKSSIFLSEIRTQYLALPWREEVEHKKIFLTHANFYLPRAALARGGRRESLTTRRCV